MTLLQESETRKEKPVHSWASGRSCVCSAWVRAWGGKVSGWRCCVHYSCSPLLPILSAPPLLRRAKVGRRETSQFQELQAGPRGQPTPRSAISTVTWSQQVGGTSGALLRLTAWVVFLTGVAESWPRMEKEDMCPCSLTTASITAPPRPRPPGCHYLVLFSAPLRDAEPEPGRGRAGGRRTRTQKCHLFPCI